MITLSCRSDTIPRGKRCSDGYGGRREGGIDRSPHWPWNPGKGYWYCCFWQWQYNNHRNSKRRIKTKNLRLVRNWVSKTENENMKNEKKRQDFYATYTRLCLRKGYLSGVGKVYGSGSCVCRVKGMRQKKLMQAEVIN